MVKINLRKRLCADKIYKFIHSHFSSIPDPRNFSKPSKVTLSDCFMSCLAVFSLKWPSLLSYQMNKKNSEVRKNLQTLFHVKTPPSDSYMRERLDEIEITALRKPFKRIFSELQRGKTFESYTFLEGHYLCSIDGTGHFSSEKIHCQNCCIKKSSGKILYYHQMLGAAIVHPDHKEVVPLCPEPIRKEDGDNKNDCERNASKRLLANLRREHPHLKLIIIEDGLASNAPHIRSLESLSMKYILGAKEGDHAFLFNYVNEHDYVYHEGYDEKGNFYQIRFLNEIPLNASNKDLKVNFIEIHITNKKGKVMRFSWVTNILISEKNMHQIIKGGRARWKIENETFNTLKNQGYKFEHNFGHGKKNLCSIMGILMILAFLIDQTQLLVCKFYQQAKKVESTFYGLWEAMRAHFKMILYASWRDFFGAIGKVDILDSS